MQDTVLFMKLKVIALHQFSGRMWKHNSRGKKLEWKTKTYRIPYRFVF